MGLVGRAIGEPAGVEAVLFLAVVKPEMPLNEEEEALVAG